MNPLAKLHKRFFAWVLSRGLGSHERLVRDRKQRLLGALSGTVLELGPGGGGNLAHLGSQVDRWLGLEPNPYFAPYVAAQDAGRSLATTLLRGRAEAIPLADASVDWVVSTLVLCSVEDVPRALREVYRVLRPGGRLVFLEHVAAHPHEPYHRVQRLLDPCWGWLADGCHLRRDLEPQLAAAGFQDLECERFLLPVPLVSAHLSGQVLRPG